MAIVNGALLALDIGGSRIGLALASREARLAHPAGYVPNTDGCFERILTIARDEHASDIVVGLPRGLNGQETAQTAAVRSFVDRLQKLTTLSIHWQDEALTSLRAEQELIARGKAFRKEDIDAMAAVYILEDYLHDNL